MKSIELEERADVSVPGRSAHAMAAHEGMGKMVVVRRAEGSTCSDDVLEQFNILPEWMGMKEKVISPSNGAIESVCFVGDAIVSAHLNGSITISHPHSDQIKRVQVCPSPLWAICRLDDTRAALVSNSAVLFVVSIPDGTIQSSLSLGIDQRLFSVAANAAGVIAVGATDSIFVVKDGAVAFTLSVARKERRLPTIVWSLCFSARDNVLASGDSRGSVSFWNTDNGALLTVVSSHQADVLSLCLSEGIVWAAGVDPRIQGIREVGPNDFQVVQKRNGPLRDVKALVSCDSKIYAAGDDHDIFVGKSGCQLLRRQWNKEVQIGGRLLMCRGSNFVDLYTTGEGEKAVDNSDEINVVRQPVYLARIHTPNQIPLIASDLSSCGTVLALSTSESTTVYRLNPKNRSKAVVRLPLQARSATALNVSSDNLLLCCGDFDLVEVPLTAGADSNVLLEQAGCGSICQLAVSPCRKFAAVITSRAQLFAIDILNRESRVVRVDLPIDVSFSSKSLFVLTAIAGYDEPAPTKKVLFEFPPAGGAPLRSVSPSVLFGRPSVRPISIQASADGDSLLVLASDGQWLVVNQNRGDISMGPAPPTDSAPFSLHFRSQSRLCSCRVESQPDSAPFKLRKFGHQ